MYHRVLQSWTMRIPIGRSSRRRQRRREVDLRRPSRSQLEATSRRRRSGGAGRPMRRRMRRTGGLFGAIEQAAKCKKVGWGFTPRISRSAALLVGDGPKGIELGRCSGGGWRGQVGHYLVKILVVREFRQTFSVDHWPVKWPIIK